MHFLEQRKNSDILLVSADHELGLFASRLEVPSINSADFYSLVKQALSKHVEGEVEKSKLIKLHGKQNTEIDALMEQAAEDITLKAEDISAEIKVPQKQNKGSKRERKLLSKLKKL